MFQVNNKDIRTTNSLYEQHSGVFIVNFEKILLIALVFPFLPLNK